MNDVDQLLQTALQHFRAGRLADAEDGCRAVLSCRGDDPLALHLLGVIAHRVGRNELAEELIGRALVRQPENVEALSNLSAVLRGLGKLDAAVIVAGKAIALAPSHAPAFTNLANALCDQGKFEEAFAAYRRSISIRPKHARTYTTLGSALSDQGKLDEAIVAHRQAIALHGDSGGAHWNLGYTLLLAGDYSGWEELEWRWSFKHFTSPSRNFSKPQWRGEDLAGQTILLHAEQGFGDTIQFARYAPLVAARGGNVILECQAALCGLLKQLPGVQRVIARGDHLPDFDIQCPLLSLPLAFGTNADSIPARIPYLLADADLSRQWSELVPKKEGIMNVGLVWAGGPKPRNRSVDPPFLEPLAHIEGINFHSLQKDKPAWAYPLPPGFRVIDQTDKVRDFSDTAALIDNLDLVITIDTAVAHLAGATGKPTWLLLLFSPDWRWQLNRSDCPWYPSMRLFRQKQFGEWGDVIEAVAWELNRRDPQRRFQD